MVENAAYSPGNVVPGIGFSPDKMLQARVLFYADAHHYRLGTHYEALPANAPSTSVKVNHYHKDGSMRFFTNDFGNPDSYHEPNQHGGPVADMAAQEPPMRLKGGAARYKQHDADADYVQSRALYSEVMNQEERNRLHSNMAAAMGSCSDSVKERWYAVLERVHPDYATGVRNAVAKEANAISAPGDTPSRADQAGSPP